MTDQLAFEFNPPTPQLPQLWTPDDMFRSCDQAVLEAFREDSRIERKRQKTDAKTLGEYLSMWANTQPHGGIIVIGVQDDGQIAGCKSASTETLNRFEQLRQYCPDANTNPSVCQWST